MNFKKLVEFGVIAFIFFGFSVAWLVLGAVNDDRTYGQTGLLLKRVQNSYGGPLIITPPRIYYEVIKERKGKVSGFDTVSSYKVKETVDPSATDVAIDLSLDRKKVGNLWFPVFVSTYRGRYEYELEAIPEEYRSDPLLLLPGLNSSESIFRSIELKLNEKAVQPLSKLVSNTPIDVSQKITGDTKLIVDFYYETTGTEYLLYELSNQGSQSAEERREPLVDGTERKRLTRLDRFNLKLTTDFLKYDFPERTIPYTSIQKDEKATDFEWQFDKTVTGKNIGVIVPEEINPGEIAARISFFAPVSLLFFFVVLTIFGILGKSELHLMHYFLLAATFLSFHLIFSYSADHLSMYMAFGIASLISCLLTYSYVVRLREQRYAVITTLLQLLYLVVFSWSFFYRTETGLGITGLIVTIVSVLTLFALMQLTAKLDWKNLDASHEN
ncbi:MAG: inner membrane CreD family protein [Pseudomonadales bacterium]|jgi:inner membrane protein involved in colicin E2 resistance|nr:inner membrane CreD family protein [Pseudomonadales bacterium]MDP7359750.1 inner membrane CreD family protein [Pseudomonadales bacterium]MDP7597919.1 inner membrane CreD family protein [Pseudomonadales bacterium]HJN50117.1 inner membrane CreD family protein [Pseudomonadales bacterium]|tara:strand:+ start:119 stop:1441 length:1323 start_codon:yes stop_codon:yes gene_type:complete